MHMPLFFVLAGCVLSDRKTVGKFVVGKLKRLMGAYLIFALLTTAMDIIIDFLLKRSDTLEGIRSGITDILLMSTESRYAYLWFFPVMFWGTFIAFLIVKHLNDDRLRILISSIILITNQLLFRLHVPSVYGFREALYAQFFIIIGYFIKQNKELIKKKSNIVICLFFALIWLYGSYEWMISGHQTVDYWNSSIEPVSWTTCTLALPGTLTIIVISVLREKNENRSYRVLEKFGLYSINIYGIHQVFLVIFAGILARINSIPIALKLPIYFVLVMISSIVASAIIELSKKIFRKIKV